MAGTNPLQDTGPWFAEVRVLSGNDEKGIMRIERTHSTLEEAEKSFSQRLVKNGMAVFPAAFSEKPQEGSLRTFDLGNWQVMDKIMDQIKECLQPLEQLKMPKPKL